MATDRDDFGRVVADDTWGTSEFAGSPLWNVIPVGETTDPGALEVDGSSGICHTDTSGTTWAMVPLPLAFPVDVLIRQRVLNVGAGLDMSWYIVEDDLTDLENGSVELFSDGATADLNAIHNAGASGTTVSTSQSIALVGGDIPWHFIRLRVEAGASRAKFWYEGDAEPAGWESEHVRVTGDLADPTYLAFSADPSGEATQDIEVDYIQIGVVDTLVCTAVDTFNRADSASPGTADAGFLWEDYGTGAAIVSNRLSMPASAIAELDMLSLPLPSGFSVEFEATGDLLPAILLFDNARFAIRSDTNEITVSYNAAFATTVLPFTFVPGTVYKFRVALTTGNIKMRVWPLAGVEPSTWMVDHIDPVCSGDDDCLHTALFHADNNAASDTYYLDNLTVGDCTCDDLPAGVGSIVLDVYRINAPGDTIEYVATLNDASAKSLRPERNAIGSGQFSINRNSANATAAILGDGTEDIRLVKVRLPQVDRCPVFSYFLERGDFTLVSPDQQGGEVFTFGGDGALAYWDRAVWLADQFTVPWWTCAGTPASTDKGQVQVEGRPETRRIYTVAGGVITGFTDETIAADACWFFRARRTYIWPGANPNGTDNKRFLVLLTSGPYAGSYIHPHAFRVTETLRSPGRINDTIELSTLGSSPGAVLYRMWQEATSVDRPSQPIPLMTIDFTATVDSDGNAWTTTDALAGVTASVGESFLTTLGNLIGTGVIDVEMGPDLDMHAWNSRARDLTGAAFGAGVVRFTRANIADGLKRELNDLPVATYTEVLGSENVVASAVLPDAASRVARETASRSDSNDPDVLEAAGLADLANRLRRSDAVGLSMTTRTETGPLSTAATGGYLPGPRDTDEGNVWTHDLVRLHTGTDNQDFDEVDLGVAALTISEDEAGGLLCQPELGSRLGANEGSFAGSAPRTVGGSGGVVELPSQTADPVTHNDLDGVVADQHHTEDHAARHADGGADEVSIAGLAGTSVELAAHLAEILTHETAESDATLVLAPDGAGGVEFRAETGGGSALTVKDEGSSLATAATSIDFVGAGVTATGAGAAKTVTIPGASVTAGQILIADNHSTPLVFADLLQVEAQDDLLYADT